MKILVIQLTRLGDILCTMPTLSALRRENPDAEIHFLVRKRFAAAAKLAPVDHLWQFDTKKVIGGLVTEEETISDVLQNVSSFIHTLRAERFDRIVNLSFSPSSSFITHLVSEQKIPVSGYTRTDDFYLAVPDVASQYFRAQVGIEKSNRLHVVDLLAWVSGVQLQKSDIELYKAPSASLVREGVVCHLGASQRDKAWPETSWVAFLRRFSQEQNQSITLIGGAEEAKLAEDISLQVGSERIINRVGTTSWPDLITLLQQSALFIGADSGPLHASSLAACPALNLSVGPVRFWETGPVTLGSRVLVCEDPGALMSDTVLENALSMMKGELVSKEAYLCTGLRGVRYSAPAVSATTPDAWAMVEWIYFEGEQPLMRGDLPAICKQAAEAADLALTQLDVLERNPQKTEVVGILDNLDEIIDLFGTNIKPLGPIVDCFRGQKENIPPGVREEIFLKTRRCYSSLRESFVALQTEPPATTKPPSAKERSSHGNDLDTY